MMVWIIFIMKSYSIEIEIRYTTTLASHVLVLTSIQSVSPQKIFALLYMLSPPTDN